MHAHSTWQYSWISCYCYRHRYYGHGHLWRLSPTVKDHFLSSSIPGMLDASPLFLRTILSSSVVTLLGGGGTVPGPLPRTPVPALSWADRRMGRRGGMERRRDPETEMWDGRKKRNNLQQNRAHAWCSLHFLDLERILLLPNPGRATRGWAPRPQRPPP